VLGWRGRALSHNRISYADLYQDSAAKKRCAIPWNFATRSSSSERLPPVCTHPAPRRFPAAPAVEILATALEQSEPTLHAALSCNSSFLLTLLLVAAFADGLPRRRNTLLIGAALLPNLRSLLGAEYAAISRQISAAGFHPARPGLEFLLRCRPVRIPARAACTRTNRADFQPLPRPRVVKNLVDSGHGQPKASAARRATSRCCFPTIRGFTTLSETRSPAEIVALLNSYFSMQVAVVFRHGVPWINSSVTPSWHFWGAPAGCGSCQTCHRGCAGNGRTPGGVQAPHGRAGSSFDVGQSASTAARRWLALSARSSARITPPSVTRSILPVASKVKPRASGRILVSAETMGSARSV